MPLTNEFPPIIVVAKALGLVVHEHKQNSGQGQIACPASAHANDKERPRCGLSNEKNSFHCLKCDSSGDAVDLVKLVQQCEVKEAFDWLRSTFNLPGRDASIEPKNPIERLAMHRGWLVEALRAMGAEAGMGEVLFPMRDATGAIVGYRTRRGDNKPYESQKYGPCKSLTKRVSQDFSPNGLIGPWPISPVDPIIITEGEADTAAVLSVGWASVIATPGSTPGQHVEEMLQKLLAGRRVILTPDPDPDPKDTPPGKKYIPVGSNWRDRLARNLGAVGCVVSYIPPINDKDIDKRLKTVSDPKAELARLVADAIPWREYSENPVSSPAEPPTPPKPTEETPRAPAAPEKPADKPERKYCPPFDNEGGPIPLGVSRLVQKGRPSIIFVGDKYWEFTEKVYEEINRYELDDDATRIINGKARRAILGDIRHLLAVEAHEKDDFFDHRDSTKIMVQNGALDIETCELLPHDASYRARNLLPITYDKNAECPRFRQALDEWLPDDPGAKALLVEWLGWCLIPETKYEKALFLVGEGSNGKGRYIRLMETLLGSHNVTGMPMLALRSDRTFPTASLEGKLLNICPESELPAELDEGWLKSLISGDTVEVEKKGRDPFPMRPYARFVIQSNNPPRLNDKSEGIWRRMIIVRFNRIFAENEQDVTLDDKLAEELPGVFNLALEGLYRLKARGRFDLSPSMIADRDEYRKECNPLATWKDECLGPVEPDYLGRPIWTPCDDVYQNYRNWCKENGHTSYSRGKFTRELKRLGVEQGLSRNDFGKVIKAFKGVELQYA